MIMPNSSRVPKSHIVQTTGTLRMRPMASKKIARRMPVIRSLDYAAKNAPKLASVLLERSATPIPNDAFGRKIKRPRIAINST